MASPTDICGSCGHTRAMHLRNWGGHCMVPWKELSPQPAPAGSPAACFCAVFHEPELAPTIDNELPPEPPPRIDNELPPEPPPPPEALAAEAPELEAPEPPPEPEPKAKHKRSWR